MKIIKSETESKAPRPIELETIEVRYDVEDHGLKKLFIVNPDVQLIFDSAHEPLPFLMHRILKDYETMRHT